MRFRTKAIAAMTAALLGMGSLPGMALAEGAWDRVNGQNAYDTMQAIVDYEGLFTPESVDAVVIATGDGYHDALAASGIAGRLGAPVLITPSDKLGEQARAEIERLQPSVAYVVGGELSVRPEVYDEIDALVDKVTRLSGATAVDTAVEIFRKTAEMAGEPWGTTAVVAASSGYWDALAAAPYSYFAKAPIFLVQQDGTIGQETLDAIAAGGFDTVLISGGPMSVPYAVDTAIESFGVAGLDVDREEGDSAIGTSAEVAAWSVEHGMDGTFIGVASSSIYHDALTGAAMAGKMGMPLVLSGQRGGIEGYDQVREKGMATGGGFVFGGPLSVSDENYEYFTSGTPIADPANPANPDAGGAPAAVPGDTYISPDAARDRALADAGLTVGDVIDLEVELDRDDRPVHYDVDFKSGGMEYDYMVDAVTGDVIYRSSEPDGRVNSANPAASDAGGAPAAVPGDTYISPDAARDRALADAGLIVGDVFELEVELDRDDRPVHYDVDFKSGGMEYDYMIDAVTGDVITKSSSFDD